MNNLISFPPKSLCELNKAAKLIKENKIDLGMGKKTQKALFNIIEQPERVSVSNIVELSEFLDVSPASLTRLSKLLGFTGFSAFHAIFKNPSLTNSSYYSENLTSQLANNESGAINYINKVINDFKQQLPPLSNVLHEDKIEKASSLLFKKRRVFIFGYGQSFSSANTFKYGLSMVRNDVYMLSHAEHGIALAATQLNSNDLLILIGSSPNSRVTMKLNVIAKEKNCSTIVITDTESSDFYHEASVAFALPLVNGFYFNSQMINCVFIESLLNFAANRHSSLALENIVQYEALLNKFQINS